MYYPRPKLPGRDLEDGRDEEEGLLGCLYLMCSFCELSLASVLHTCMYMALRSRHHENTLFRVPRLWGQLAQLKPSAQDNIKQLEGGTRQRGVREVLRFEETGWQGCGRQDT